MANEAKVAAKWWADRLANRRAQDIGDGGLSTTLQPFIDVTARPLDMVALARFQAELERLIEADLASRGWCELYVDYQPNRILSSAASTAGLVRGAGGWPWKTTMHVKPGIVTVKDGYSADWIVL